MIRDHKGGDLREASWEEALTKVVDWDQRVGRGYRGSATS